MSQNVIELNGKRYDATTGALLGKSPAGAVSHLAQNAPVPPPGRVIDGFFRQSAAPQPAKKKPAKKAAPSAQAMHKPQHAAASAPHPVKSAATATPRAAHGSREAAPAQPHHTHLHAHPHEAGATARRHEPQHSRTLMRTYVHKPETHLKPAIKPQAPAEVAARPVSSLMKHSATQVDPSRLERAKSTARHEAVRRFHASHYGSAPVHHAVQAGGHVPVIPVKPHPAHVAPATAESPSKPADIFETALKHARSHEQPLFKHPRRRRRFHSAVAGVVAFVILGGFIAYLNVPNIQLHIASVEAGFHASMPGYAPIGYALHGGIEHNGGTVTMHFTSGDSSYQITQQSSNWDSQALLDNTLALSGPHKTIERGGRIIYIYGDNNANASWVTNNVRYDITGNASLGANELANIAASM